MLSSIREKKKSYQRGIERQGEADEGNYRKVGEGIPGGTCKGPRGRGDGSRQCREEEAKYGYLNGSQFYRLRPTSRPPWSMTATGLCKTRTTNKALVVAGLKMTDRWALTFLPLRLHS